MVPAAHPHPEIPKVPLPLSGDASTAWPSHIDKLFTKIPSGIGAIKRIRPFVSAEILHYIYNPISITVVLSGVIAAKRSLKDYRNCRIVLLAF